VRIGTSCDVRHCHGLTGIAGYVVVRIRARLGSRGEGRGAEARSDLAVLEGAGQYLRARDQARALYAGNTAPGVHFGVDVVYTDGCRMPW
jgi:hypothetical protein